MPSSLPHAGRPATLGGLVVSGVSALRLVCAPLGPDVPVRSVRVADRDDVAVERDDLVLAVGDRADARRLVAVAGAARAAGVVVRDLATDLRPAATDAGVALLRRVDGTTWDQVYRLAESVVPRDTDDVVHVDVPAARGVVTFAPLAPVDPATRDRLRQLVWYFAELAAPTDHAALREMATEVVERIGAILDVPLCAGIGASAAEAERVVAVLRGRDDLDRVASHDEVRPSVAVAAARAVLAGLPHLRLPELAALRAHDADRGTGYVATLKAYLDTFGDAAASAQRVGVHLNTFRYRLRRLVDLAGLDLADAGQRFACELELSGA
jgi:hypothetical protein